MNSSQEQLFRVMFEVRKNARNLSFADNIPPAVFHLLLMIHKHGKEMEYEGSMCKAIEGHELFHCIKVSKPAVSRLLKNCESKGYVARIDSKEDRRAMVVVLLEKGRLELEESEKQAKITTSRIFDEIGQDDVEELIRIFSKMNLVISSFKERK